MNVPTVAHVSESPEASSEGSVTEKATAKGNADAFAILLAHLLTMATEATAESALLADTSTASEDLVPEEMLEVVEEAAGEMASEAAAAEDGDTVAPGAVTSSMDTLLRMAAVVKASADASETVATQAEQATAATDTDASSQVQTEETASTEEVALQRAEQLASRVSYRLAEAGVRVEADPEDTSAGATVSLASESDKTQKTLVSDTVELSEDDQDSDPVDALARRLAARASLAPQEKLTEALDRSVAAGSVSDLQAQAAEGAAGTSSDAAEARLAGVLSETAATETTAAVTSDDGAGESVSSTRPTVENLATFTVRSVRYLVSQGTKTMTVRLVPESLGELRVDVSTVSDGVHVRLTSQHPMVREALESQLPGLRDALARDGLTIAKVSVSVDSGLGQAWSGDSGREQALFEQAASSKPSLQALRQFEATEEGDQSQARAPSHDGVLNMLI